MLDVAGFCAFLSIGDPVGIGLELVASSLSVRLTPEAPEEDNLVDCPDFGGEDADRLAEMPDVDRHALGLIQCKTGAEPSGHHGVGPHIDNHGYLPPVSPAALHTVQIFGDPIFTYSYREAVIDGWLIDHEPPIRIETELTRAGIIFHAGEQVEIFNTRTGRIDLVHISPRPTCLGGL
jgi:hypothetical protein